MKAIGIDVGGHFLRAGLVDSDGKILKQLSVQTDASLSKEGIVEQISGLVSQLSTPEIVGVGLGVPGFMNVQTGVVYSSPNFPEWKNFQLGHALKENLKWPFVLENDANCAALGESWVGESKGARNSIFITLGTGVGGGIIANNNLISGKNGTGGEIGHMVIDINGPKCGCGGTGCLESLISSDHILKKTGKDPQEWEKMAKEGESKALLMMDEIGRYLGIAASSLCQLFDPDVIVLGGKMSRAFQFFYPALRKELNERLQNHPARNVRVVQASLDDQAGVLGAAFSVLRNK